MEKTKFKKLSKGEFKIIYDKEVKPILEKILYRCLRDNPKDIQLYMLKYLCSQADVDNDFEELTVQEKSELKFLRKEIKNYKQRDNLQKK